MAQGERTSESRILWFAKTSYDQNLVLATHYNFRTNASAKYVGMDVRKESIAIAVANFVGKVVMEYVIETKASTILQFIDGLRGDVHVTFEEGTWAAWLTDLLKPRVTKVVVCNPRKTALLKDGSKGDKIDARKLAELLRLNHLEPVYHGENGVRTLREMARSYLTITGDLTRVLPLAARRTPWRKGRKASSCW